MVPDERPRTPLADEVAALIRPRAVAHGVAQTPDLVRWIAVDLLQHRLERVKVRVDVGDDCEPHAEIVGDRCCGCLARRCHAALADGCARRVASRRGSIDGVPRRVPRAKRPLRAIQPRELGARDARPARRPRRVCANRAAIPRAGIPGGVALGLGTLVAVWVAGLPFVLAAHWWRRRYDVSDADYATILVDPWLERIGGLAVAGVAIALAMVLAGGSAIAGGSSAAPRSPPSARLSSSHSRICSPRGSSRYATARLPPRSASLRERREWGRSTSR